MLSTPCMQTRKKIKHFIIASTQARQAHEHKSMPSTRACKHVKHVSTPSTQARKHVSTQACQAWQHVRTPSKQAREAREHANTKSTQARQARDSADSSQSLQGKQENPFFSASRYVNNSFSVYFFLELSYERMKVQVKRAFKGYFFVTKETIRKQTRSA